MNNFDQLPSGYSIEQVIQHALDALSGVSDSPKLDVELLLCHQLQCNRTYLFTWPEKILSTADIIGFRELFQQRQNGLPIAHILGEREFWGLNLKVTADTLIPRPDTETLVEQALQLLGEYQKPKILDLGTGTGAIALALKSEFAQSEVTAIDFSAKALAIAKENSQILQLPITCIESAWFQALPTEAKFDLIVSNPPYIEENDPHLTQGDVRFEPITALTSGKDGLEDIRLIAKGATKHLSTNGWLVIEHGYNQALAVQQILQENGFSQVASRKDYGNNDRVTYGQMAH